MGVPVPAVSHVRSRLETYLPALRPAQQRGLAEWVTGVLAASSGCEAAVVAALEPLGLEPQALRARLRENPGDIPVRERLGHVLAENLGELAAGIEHLQTLQQMPEATPEQKAAWLGTIAGWHLQIGQDREAARWVLEELVRDYPGSPEAKFGARRLNELTEAPGASQPPPLPKMRIRVNLDKPSDST